VVAGLSFTFSLDEVDFLPFGPDVQMVFEVLCWRSPCRVCLGFFSSLNIGVLMTSLETSSPLLLGVALSSVFLRIWSAVFLFPSWTLFCETGFFDFCSFSFRAFRLLPLLILAVFELAV